ncbi:hypothetical protein ACOI22_09645 [Glaciecola sp. 2405UD65-10]|uniref:hypothetical protein n=1 Tax=Glaciecola sp. 2405UD65-10 TaxID=3397244 RepID=UPI003B596EED
MPKRNYLPNTVMMSAIKGRYTKPFTVVEIRDQLQRVSNLSECPAALRRWVNGQFQTLKKHKYIEETVTDDGKKYYLATEKTATFKLSNETATETAVDNDEDSSTLNALNERLKACKLDLLSYAGETREYEELSQQYPKLRGQLQNKFNIAQEKRIETTGRIRALESLLSDRPEWR